MTEEDGSVVVEYVDAEENKRDIRTSWFIGADGKRGVVRKKFLEPEGIVQRVGLYVYSVKKKSDWLTIADMTMFRLG